MSTEVSTETVGLGRDTTLLDVRQRRRAALTRAGRRQGLAVFGQLFAGVVNLVISAVLARVLLPGEYAGFVAFLAGYVLLHTVASSVTAAVALDPSLHERLIGHAVAVGLLVGGALAATSELVAEAVGLSVGTVLLLALAAPSATLLALARGRLYGLQRVRGTVATLCAEPIGRAVFGLALLPLIGSVGAAAAVVLAGYVALGTALWTGRDTLRTQTAEPTTTEPATRTAPRSWSVTMTFLLVAVVAAQDVILANRLLPGAEAGVVAAVATLGGAAYFATATIPMMLLPQGAAGRSALWVALAAALGLSLAGVVAVALVPADLYVAVLGEGYRGVDELVVGYVAAMGALGVTKVLLARLCSTGRGRSAWVLVAVGVLVQLGLLLPATTADDVVTATVLACALLLMMATGATLLVPRRTAADTATLPAPETVPAPATAPVLEPGTSPAPRTRPEPAPPRPSRWRSLWPLWLALALGIALRMVVTRSIWVDEAISIQQAQLPFGEMIDTLREDDVHPPLFATLLWAVVQLTGSTAEWVVRLPSLIAGSVFIAVLYAMARDLFDRRTAVVAGFVAAVAPVAVWYAQEARMYAIWMLLATLAAWAQLRILRADAEDSDRVRWLDWTVFCLSSVALLYLQWFALLPVLVQHLVFAAAALRRRSPQLGRSWGWGILGSLALFVPLVPFLLAQGASVLAATSANAAPAQTGADASTVASDVPDVYAVVANTIWALWGYHADTTMVLLSALWPVAVLTCFAALGRARSPHTLTLLLIAVLPAAALFAIGFERRQFFELRYFTSTVPMLLLLLSRAAATWARGPLTRVLLPVLVVLSLTAGLVDQQVNRSNPRTYDFRGAVAWVQQEGDAEDVLLYAPGFLNHELAYYPAGMTTLSASGVEPLAEESTGMPAPPAEGRSVFVFASFLDQPAVAAQVGKTLADLENSGAREVERYEVANVTVWEFEEDGR